MPRSPPRGHPALGIRPSPHRGSLRKPRATPCGSVPPQRLTSPERAAQRINLESTVGTTHFAVSTDKLGLGFALPHTCEVRAQPRWKRPFQSRPSVQSAVTTTAVFRFNGHARCPTPEALKPIARGAQRPRGLHAYGRTYPDRVSAFHRFTRRAASDQNAFLTPASLKTQRPQHRNATASEPRTFPLRVYQ
jgi:hypothetical protein